MSVRERQHRYRQRRKAAGYHRLDVWIPSDLMAAIDALHTEYGPFQKPQLALIRIFRERPRRSRRGGIAGRPQGRLLFG